MDVIERLLSMFRRKKQLPVTQNDSDYDGMSHREMEATASSPDIPDVVDRYVANMSGNPHDNKDTRNDPGTSGQDWVQHSKEDAWANTGGDQHDNKDTRNDPAILPKYEKAPQSELVPIEGHPGQFTNGMGKGGHDPTTGYSMGTYPVYDASGNFLGENATLVQGDTTTNFGFSYSTPIPRDIDLSKPIMSRQQALQSSGLNSDELTSFEPTGPSNNKYTRNGLQESVTPSNSAEISNSSAGMKFTGADANSALKERSQGMNEKYADKIQEARAADAATAMVDTGVPAWHANPNWEATNDANRAAISQIAPEINTSDVLEVRAGANNNTLLRMKDGTYKSINLSDGEVSQAGTWDSSQWANSGFAQPAPASSAAVTSIPVDDSNAPGGFSVTESPVYDVSRPSDNPVAGSAGEPV